MDGPVDLTRHAGKRPIRSRHRGRSRCFRGRPGPARCPAHAPGRVRSVSISSMGLPSRFRGGTHGEAGRGAFRGPDQITIGAGMVSGDSRAERLKFESQAKFFNPFNRVNFRSARRRSRPSRNKEGFRTTRLARGIQAAKDPRIGQLYAETGEPIWFALPN